MTPFGATDSSTVASHALRSTEPSPKTLASGLAAGSLVLMAFGLDSVIELACGTAAARQTTFHLGDRAARRPQTVRTPGLCRSSPSFILTETEQASALRCAIFSLSFVLMGI